ncbi:MAG: stalk domain-containing protein, partial [Butyricicoccus sp.]
TRITGSTTVNLTADQTLYAHWVKVPDVIVGNKIMLQINNPKMHINGIAQNIDSSGTMPVIRSSRTLLPVRAVIESMNGSVGWNNDTRTTTMTIGNKTLFLQIGNSKAWDSQGKTYSLDAAPTIINSRTMLPIRFVVEYFGGSVDWDAGTQTVTIEY